MKSVSSQAGLTVEERHGEKDREAGGSESNEKGGGFF